ncbi:MAG: hypothetical protein FJZ58_02420, partial [Chlamydiae bacterium]|nr:hypothetical protein [Chlamydiota bacterium]
MSSPSINKAWNLSDKNVGVPPPSHATVSPIPAVTQSANASLVGAIANPVSQPEITLSSLEENIIATALVKTVGNLIESLLLYFEGKFPVKQPLLPTFSLAQILPKIFGALASIEEEVPKFPSEANIPKPLQRFIARAPELFKQLTYLTKRVPEPLLQHPIPLFSSTKQTAFAQSYPQEPNKAPIPELPKEVRVMVQELEQNLPEFVKLAKEVLPLVQAPRYLPFRKSVELFLQEPLVTLLAPEETLEETVRPSLFSTGGLFVSQEGGGEVTAQAVPQEEALPQEPLKPSLPKLIPSSKEEVSLLFPPLEEGELPFEPMTVEAGPVRPQIQQLSLEEVALHFPMYLPTRVPTEKALQTERFFPFFPYIQGRMMPIIPWVEEVRRQPTFSTQIPFAFIVPYVPVSSIHTNPASVRPLGKIPTTEEGAQDEEAGGGKSLSQLLVYIPGGESLYGDPFEEGALEERPLRKIFLRPFAIGIYPVTYGQFAEYLNEQSKAGLLRLDEKGRVLSIEGRLLCQTKLGTPTSHMETEAFRLHLGFRASKGKEHYPMTFVSYLGAEAFCKAGGFRLPTEPEWERAASLQLDPSGIPMYKFRYGFGSDLIDPSCANYKLDSGMTTLAEGEVVPIGCYNGKRVFIKRKSSVQTIDAKSPLGCYDMSGNVAQWTS